MDRILFFNNVEFSAFINRSCYNFILFQCLGKVEFSLSVMKFKISLNHGNVSWELGKFKLRTSNLCTCRVRIYWRKYDSLPESQYNENFDLHYFKQSQKIYEISTGEHVHNLEVLNFSTANSLISCFTHLSSILNDVRCPDVPDLQGFHYYRLL